MSINYIKPQVEINLNPRYVDLLSVSNNHHGMEKHAGTIIRTRLIQLEKTQQWLADEVGCSINAVSKWTKTGKISRINAVLVSRVLGISLDDLLSGSSIADASDQDELSLERLTSSEAQLMQLYRRLTPAGRDMLLAAAGAAPKKPIR